MYWLRSTQPLDLGLYLLLSFVWVSGGVLLAGRLFRLRPGERFLTGLATGWILWISLANLLTPWLDLPGAAWAAGLLILVAGVVARVERLPRAQAAGPGVKGLRFTAVPLAAINTRSVLASAAGWLPQAFVLTALTILFAFVQRGLSIFDDYLHIPLVSVMATGDIPPHFYLNPAQEFAYHYGLQVWAASLVRLAGLNPWSAWDFSKAFAIALTLALGWVWVKRATGSKLVATLGSLLLSFAGGARWLMLLLPGRALTWLSSHVQLINTGMNSGPTLTAALTGSWVIEGGGPLPFPFAYHNGIFTPVVFLLGSTGALPFVTVLVLLLLANSRKLSWLGAGVMSLVLANLALSAEHLFALAWVGLVVVLAWSWIKGRERLANLLPWGFVLGASALLSLIQGGFITVAYHSILARLAHQAPTSGNLYGFSLRWPPSLYSAHLGVLSLFDPAQLVTLLFELGPALLLCVPATWYGVRAMKRGHWLEAALALAALLAMIFPLFFEYGVDRSTTRLPGTALWLWVLLVIPVLLRLYRRAGNIGRAVLGAGFAVEIFSAVVIFAFQLTAIPQPQFASFLGGMDAQMSARQWNRLEPGAQVMDHIPYRAVTVFGRAATEHQSIYVALPAWEALLTNPDPAAIRQAGFSYLYVDNQWWQGLGEAQRLALQQPCIRIAESVEKAGGNFRRLLDVRDCR